MKLRRNNGGLLKTFPVYDQDYVMLPRDDKAWLRNEKLLPDHMPEQYCLPDEEVLRMAPAIYQWLLNKE